MTVGRIPSNFLSNTTQRLPKGRDTRTFDGLFDPGSLELRKIGMPTDNSERVLKEAAEDLASAKDRAGHKLRLFAADPENFAEFASALDMKTPATRSPEQREAAQTFLANLAQGHSADTSLDFGRQVTLPDFVLSKTYDPMAYDYQPPETALPEGVAMAYLPSDEQVDTALFSSNLGFRDMHLEAQNALSMSVVHHAKKHGVDIAKGDVSTRLAAILGPQDMNGADNTGHQGQFDDLNAQVWHNGELYDVAPPHYSPENP